MRIDNISSLCSHFNLVSPSKPPLSTWTRCLSYTSWWTPVVCSLWSACQVASPAPPLSPSPSPPPSLSRRPWRRGRDVPGQRTLVCPRGWSAVWYSPVHIRFLFTIAMVEIELQGKQQHHNISWTPWPRSWRSALLTWDEAAALYNLK